MQSARRCIVILLRHGLAQKNLNAADAGLGCGDGKPAEVKCFAAAMLVPVRPGFVKKMPAVLTSASIDPNFRTALSMIFEPTALSPTLLSTRAR